jgi:hypothetical protein
MQGPSAAACSSNLNRHSKGLVAIKVIDKKKLTEIGEPGDGPALLLNEIKVHWHLHECDGILSLLELFED